jgi:hypothetical protein
VRHSFCLPSVLIPSATVPQRWRGTRRIQVRVFTASHDSLCAACGRSGAFGRPPLAVAPGLTRHAARAALMTHSVGADAAKASLSGGHASVVAPPARSLWASEPTALVAPRCAAPAGAAMLDALHVGRSAAVEIPGGSARNRPARPPASSSAVLVGVPARPRPLGEVVPPTTPPVTIPLRLSIQPMAVDGGSSGDLATRCA